MKRILLSLAALVVVVFLGAFLAWRQYSEFLLTPVAIPAQGMVVDVPAGAPVRAVLTDLERKGVLVHDWKWRVLTRLEPVMFKAGEYDLDGPLTPAGLLAHLSSGQVRHYRFTIVEGWTFAQALAALQEAPVLRHEAPLLDGGEALLEAIGIDQLEPEGWFLPETYQYVRGDSDLDILQRAHAAMQRTLNEAWSGRSDDIPLKSPYELLVLASIVERETAVAAERAAVAGVFTRRLQLRWRLESDPTVIYGLGDAFDGDIRRRDLEADTPWNTYTRYGLPPTPIALPGADALFATAQPEQGTAMFFVANGLGGHTFSDTLAEHNRAVAKLLRKRP